MTPRTPQMTSNNPSDDITVRSRVLMPDYDPIADLTNYHEATLPKVATILQAWFYPVNHDSLRPEQTSDNASEGQDKVKPPQYILNHAQ